MPNELPSISIDSSPEYQQNLRDLAKRYRSIRSDTQTVIEQLQSGNFVGDRIAGIGEDYIVYKVRVRNSNTLLFTCLHAVVRTIDRLLS